MSLLGNRRREKRDKETRERQRLERIESRRDWKERKPRPLLDLIKGTTGLIKWLLLAGGAAYLFLNGTNLFQLFKK